MLLTPKQLEEVVFVESRVWRKTETSNPMTFVTIADARNFERFEFIADKDCKTLFQQGQPVSIELNLGNYNGRPSVQVSSLELKK